MIPGEDHDFGCAGEGDGSSRWARPVSGVLVMSGEGAGVELGRWRGARAVAGRAGVSGPWDAGKGLGRCWVDLGRRVLLGWFVLPGRGERERRAGLGFGVLPFFFYF